MVNGEWSIVNGRRARRATDRHSPIHNSPFTISPRRNMRPLGCDWSRARDATGIRPGARCCALTAPTFNGGPTAMKFILTLIPALLFSTAALSQEVAEESAKDLWCGLAFGIISAEVPADVNEQQQALVKQYTDGGLM